MANRQTQASPMGLSGAKLPIVQVLRSIVRELPRPNTRGELAWKKNDATGNAAIIELLKPENRVTDTEFRKLLREKMPSYPLIQVPNPEIRAKKLLSLNKGQLHTFPLVVKQAADQFRVPEGQRILFIGPEYFCRDLLLKEGKFQVKDNDGLVTGIMPPCPWCRSNSGVSFRTFECQNVQASPRGGVHTDSTRYPLLGARYWCKAKGCVGEVPDGEEDDSGRVTMVNKEGEVKLNKSGDSKGDPMIWVRHWHEDQNHSFVIWNKKCFEQFPSDVKKVFSRFVFGLAHDYDGAEPNLLPTPELAMELLNTSNTFSSLTKNLQTHHQVQREHAKQAYYEFVKHHGQKYSAASSFFLPAGTAPTTPTVPWPDFDEQAFKLEMGPPSETALENVFWLSFEMIQPYLQRDLLSRTPGRFVRWDGTYSAAKKMINIDELDSIETLLLLTGEYGDIVSYAFAHDENPSNWQILHYFLMKRCKKKGNKVLHDVKFGYDDLGSMNYSDPAKHWFATVWPAAERGPLKDPLHAVMLVGRSTYAHKHPMNDWFARELTGCLMQFEKESIRSAAAQLQSECTNTSPEVAVHTVKTQRSWKKKMYNYTVTKSQQVRRVRAFWEKAQQEDTKYMEEGHPRFLKLQSPTSRSTGCEIGQLLSHIERGDYQDPLPPRQMSFVRRTARAKNVPPTKKMKHGLPDLCRLRGTNTVESSNKQINYSVHSATRLRKKLCDAKVQLKIHEHNIKKDREFGGKTGRSAKDVFWLLQEANDLIAAEIEYLNKHRSLDYPPREYDAEPLGLDFEYYKKYLATVEIEYLDKIQDGKRPARPPAFGLANPGGPSVPTNTATPSPTPSPAPPPTPPRTNTATPGPTPPRKTTTPSSSTPPPTNTATPSQSPPPTHPHAQKSTTPPRKTTTPSPSSPPTDLDEDFDDFLNNFDVDSFIQQERPPTIATTPPRTRQRSPASPASLPSPSPSKKQRYKSGGATVYNRKEGNRSLMSPTRMTVQQPLNVGQNDRMAKILTKLTSDGTPKQLVTASSTAKAVMDAWNHEEYRSNLDGAVPMGVLPIGVAKAVVGGMSNDMVKARADGKAETRMLTPLEIQDPYYKSTMAPPKKKVGRKRLEVGPIPEIKELTEATIRQASARKIKAYIQHYNSAYGSFVKPATLPGGRKIGLENSLIDLVSRVNTYISSSSSSSATESTKTTNTEWL